MTRLASANLGTFGFFLDIGCLQGLDAEQWLSMGSGVMSKTAPRWYRLRRPVPGPQPVGQPV